MRSERHDPTELKECETPALINLYTLLSDVQRNAGDLRQDVREVLLGGSTMTSRSTVSMVPSSGRVAAIAR